MPLMSFSEPDHIAKLLDGRKQQTTRLPRKNPINEGNILYCYYKPRAKKTCKTCINPSCPKSTFQDKTGLGEWLLPLCSPQESIERHINYFGTATVIEVVPIKTIIGNNSSERSKDEWAKADGFANWKAADEWFSEKYSADWRELPFETIYFNPRWLKCNCSECGYYIEFDLILDCKDLGNNTTRCTPIGYICPNCDNTEMF